MSDTITLHKVPATIAVRTNPLAVIALVASILSFFLLPVVGAITGVITGHIALRQIKQTGEQGRQAALWGTILGYVHLTLGLAVAAVLIIAVTVVGITALPHLFING